MAIAAAACAAWAPHLPFELDAFTVDPPRLHDTPVKLAARVLLDASGADAANAGRWAVFPFRLLALFAALAAARTLLAARGALWIETTAATLCVYGFLPAFVRADPSMDSVSWFAIGLWCAATQRWFFAGACAALAVDAKTTVLLTLIPALVVGLHQRRLTARDVCIATAGAIVALVAAQPQWVIHPAVFLEHIQHYRSVAPPPLPWHEPFRALIDASPIVLIALAAAGFVFARRDKMLWPILIIGAFPLVFLAVYRTYPADGVRHILLTIPFWAAPAALTIDRFSRWRIPIWSALAANVLFMLIFNP